MGLCTEKAQKWPFQEYWVSKQPFLILASLYYIALGYELLMFLSW